MARKRAAKAGVAVTFDVADATNLTGYDGRFNTVIDSALYHCLDKDDDRRAYAAGLHRATQPGARWFLYCFSAGNVNDSVMENSGSLIGAVGTGLLLTVTSSAFIFGLCAAATLRRMAFTMPAANGLPMLLASSTLSPIAA